MHHCPTIWPACQKSLSRWPLLLWLSVWLPSLQRAVMALTEAAAINQPLHKASAAKGVLIGRTLCQAINLFRLGASSNYAISLFLCNWDMGSEWILANFTWDCLIFSDCVWTTPAKNYTVNILTTQQNVCNCLCQSTRSSTFPQLFLCFVRQHMVENESTHGNHGNKLIIWTHDL